MARNPLYLGNAKGDMVRVVALIPASEIEAVDGWGAPAGMPHRTAAIRFLIQKGLEAVRASTQSRQLGGAPTAGTASQA